MHIEEQIYIQACFVMRTKDGRFYRGAKFWRWSKSWRNAAVLSHQFWDQWLRDRHPEDVKFITLDMIFDMEIKNKSYMKIISEFFNRDRVLERIKTPAKDI